jgi:hypothetical protein
MTLNQPSEPSATGSADRFAQPERTTQTGSADFPPDTRLLVRTAFQMTLERTLATDALMDLHQLVGQHAPSWYTREQQESVVTVLRLLGRL